MDPVGASLGAASLLFQVFASCMQAYGLLCEAKGFEKDYHFIRIRFKAEQYRLLDFATVAKLSEKDDTLLIKASNKDTLLEVLGQQKMLMMRFGRLDDRHRPLARPLLREEADINPNSRDINSKQPDDDGGTLADRFPRTNALLMKSLEFVRSTQKYPARLRWVVFDKEKLEVLLSRLVSSNNFLQELLNNHQLEALRDQEVHTSYQVMQLHSKLDHLKDLVRAGLLSIREASISGPSTTSPLNVQDNPPPAYSGGSALLPSLVKLGQFKAVAAAVANESLTPAFRDSLGLDSNTKEEAPLQLQQEDVVFEGDGLEEISDERRVSAWYQSPEGPRRRIWVEWKRLEPKHMYNVKEGPDPDTLRRFRALVTLLRQHDQIRHFRAPLCLGYYLHTMSPTNIQYGLLFQRPADADPETPPTSLRQLLEDRHTMPSLTTRLGLLRTITQAVEKLHAVNWLHKGLCSENVIFFHGGDAELTEPYLTGFDYSRPGNAASMSSNPASTFAEDLYRHPGVQGRPREGSNDVGYRKCHDIYSLGVILVEIALWKPIEGVLGIGIGQKVKGRDATGARNKLLGLIQEGHLRGAVGNAVSDAINACLVGPAAFELAESDQEVDGNVAAKLQMMFYNVVVGPLVSVNI